MIHKSNFYIVTGGPGVGKTTLLEELQRRGCRYVPEVARNIIKEQMETGGNALPWKNSRLYSDRMLSLSIRDFIRYSSENKLLFFDRGIPDTYGYEVLMKFNRSELLEKTVVEYRYNRIVFILPPWKEIYQKDEERKQDFEEAVQTFNIMFSVYKELGYIPIEVPCLPISERADFVLDKIGVNR
jgi:Predicted ATPase